MPDLAPTADLDGAETNDILDLFNRVKDGWAARDKDIKDAVELRNQKWTVNVPKAWQKTATQHHTSRSKEIPQRVTGTLMLNLPIYSRPNPGEDFDLGMDQNQVERFLQAYMHYWDRKALKSRSALEFMYDCFVGKGGVCVGSLLMPQQWASAPMLFDGGEIRQEHWRDSTGKATTDKRAMDLEASSRGFLKTIERYGKTISASDSKGMPLRRRVLPPEQCFPIIVEDQLLGLFIERKTSMLELAGGGWSVAVESKNVGMAHSFLEFHTPNRCRYYMDTKPVVHPNYGEDGLVTDNGFIPYVYQTSLMAGETDYGSWGMPVLGLVDSNIRTIDTLRTYLMNAVHLASFTSFYIEYQGDDKSVGVLVDTKSGKRLTTFEFKSGTIMDFGPGRKVVPLTHPGLNADFWKALAEEEKDLDLIIPRTLSGQPSSSGYNTVVSSVQGRALYNSIYRASELLLEQVAEHDLRLLETLPRPVYLEWEQPSNSARSKKYDRVRIDAKLIGGYYAVGVSIDRTIDPITEGTFRANMVSQGVGDTEWAAEGAGIVDYEDMILRQDRDRALKDPSIMAILAQRAVKRFGLIQAQAEAAAAGRIQMQPDGTAAVMTKDGRVAAPGMGIQGGGPPQAQGALGAQGGSTNNLAPQSTGGPNPSSTQNPSIQQPAPTPTHRTRTGRRGGATAGSPQRQPYRPALGNPAQ